jgi:hypothetical protein
MTRLFSSGERTRITSRRYNEAVYSFLDTSAWPSVDRVREFWDAWFSQYDNVKKPGLAARFQSYDNHQHLSAFLELFTFAVLRRSGFDIEIEPRVGKRALEFFASMNERDLKFYVECTATGQRAAQASADAREAEALEAIDKAPTGHFLLQVEFERCGSQAPPIRRLRADLTSWLASLDHAAAIDQLREANRLSKSTWKERDWVIKFAALPAEAESGDDEGALGFIGPHDLDTTEHLRLRHALDVKASRYGRLDSPLVVVADSTGHQRDRDLMLALLGDVVWDVDLKTNHASERFLPNGVFGSPRKPRNVVLSAVMHGHFDVLSFADRPMILFHHPFARKPLPLGLFPFCKELHFDRDTGRLVTVAPTTSVGEFFGLPSGWPFFDRDPY